MGPSGTREMMFGEGLSQPIVRFQDQREGGPRANGQIEILGNSNDLDRSPPTSGRDKADRSLRALRLALSSDGALASPNSDKMSQVHL